MRLSDAACRAAKPSDKVRKLSDGGGLQLWVMPNGGKLWRLAYRHDGRQKLLALGVYPVVSLAEARERRDDAKKALAKGVDPSRERKRVKAVHAAADTFQTVAEEYRAKLVKERRAPATLDKIDWILRLTYPAIGKLKINDVRVADILPLLRKVEARGKYETAKRMRSLIGAVIRYAVATGRAEIDPTPTLRGALAAPVVIPRPAVKDPKAFGAMLRAIDDFDGQPTIKAALQLMALLFPRPGELRAAEWREFDLTAATWTIPAARTKTRREHRMPLPPQAIRILTELRMLTGASKLAFPNVRSMLRPISENTMNAALRRLGYAQDEATAHGFRATASTLLNESRKWSPDAIERQLGHLDQNEVRRAYARGDYWDERVEMLGWWAGYLDDLRKTAPTALPAAA